MTDPTPVLATPNDQSSIISRKKYVKESLELIKDKKERLRQTMKAISESEQPDMALMGKLIEAYDMMTVQENQYLEVLKSIVIIHEHAVEDVAQEVEQAKAELASMPKTEEKPAEPEKSIEELEALVDDPNASEEMKELMATLKEIQQVSQQAALAAQLNEQLEEKLNLHKKKKATLQEIRKDKAKLLQKKANDALNTVEMTRIRLENEKTSKKQKQMELERLRKEALMKGIQLGIVEDEMKEAAVRAVSELTDEASRIPPIESETPEQHEQQPELTEEEKLEERRKQIRENVRKERERKEQVNQQIRERLRAMEARKERIKQLREMLEASHKQAEAEKAAEETSKEAAESAAPVEGAASNEEEATSTVEPEAKTQEKTVEAVLPEKKAENEPEQANSEQKVEEVSPSDDLPDDLTEEERREYERTEKELSETIRNATLNLQNLTLMRMRLEEMQSRGEALNEDDVNLINCLDSGDLLPPERPILASASEDHSVSQQDEDEDEEIDDVPPPPPTTAPPSLMPEGEIEKEIRRQFRTAFKPKRAFSANQATSESSGNSSDQLDRLETLLRQQMRDVREIKDKVCPTMTAVSASVITKSALLRAPSNLLSSLAQVFSLMASGQQTAARDLDQLLVQLYLTEVVSSASQLHHHPNQQQQQQQTQQQTQQASLQDRSEDYDAFESVIVNPQAQEFKPPSSIRSSEAVLAKQRTVDNVRFAMEPTTIHDACEDQNCSSSSSSDSSSSRSSSENPMSSPNYLAPADIMNNQNDKSVSPAVQQRKSDEELHQIVHGILNILHNHVQSVEVVSEDLAESVRELIAALACQQFRRVSDKLIHSQLGSVIFDTVMQFDNLPIKQSELRKQFLCDISDILLNEFPYFQLLDSVQSIPDTSV